MSRRPTFTYLTAVRTAPSTPLARQEPCPTITGALTPNRGPASDSPGAIGGFPKVVGQLIDQASFHGTVEAFLDKVRQRATHSLCELHQDIPDEAVADDYVGLVGEEVHALHVADEVEVAVLKHLVAFLDLPVALGRLLPHAEQPDAGVIDAHIGVGEGRAQHGETEQQSRSAVEVAAYVHQNSVGSQPQERSAEAGALQAFP